MSSLGILFSIAVLLMPLVALILINLWNDKEKVSEEQLRLDRQASLINDLLDRLNRVDAELAQETNETKRLIKALEEIGGIVVGLGDDVLQDIYWCAVVDSVFQTTAAVWSGPHGAGKPGPIDEDDDCAGQ